MKKIKRNYLPKLSSLFSTVDYLNNNSDGVISTTQMMKKCRFIWGGTFALTSYLKRKGVIRTISQYSKRAPDRRSKYFVLTPKGKEFCVCVSKLRDIVGNVPTDDKNNKTIGI